MKRHGMLFCYKAEVNRSVAEGERKRYKKNARVR